MELLDRTAATLDHLLGHGDAPGPVSLPLAAWAVAVAGDGLAAATGARALDRLATVATGAGLVASAGSFVTGLVERRSGGVRYRGHEAGVAAHVVGSLGVRGLFAASFLIRLRAGARGEPVPALARGLALAGGGLALANALLTHRLMEHGAEPDDAQGRARLDPASPLGLHHA